MSTIDNMQTVTSFSGADLLVSFGKKVVGELQQISWATHREKTPVYTLGSPDARSVSRGKRGIGGSLIVAQLDRDAIMEELKMQWGDIAPRSMFTASPNLSALYKPGGWSALDGTVYGKTTPGDTPFNRALSMTDWDLYATKGQSPTADDSEDAVSTLTNEKALSSNEELNMPDGFALMHVDNIIYLDQMPPVDVTLTFANEYGNAAFMKIYDLEFISEASGVSVDTIVMEKEISWLGRKMSPIMQGVYKSDNQYGIPLIGKKS